MAYRTFAAIDVGSFELELGIYEISAKNGIREIDHLRHVIVLGEDTYNNGKISYGLVNEMCQVLEKFTEVMKAYKVEACRAVATSAMREAKNRQIILEQIRVRTGIQVEIISNSEQRFLIYKAIAAIGDEFGKIIQKGTAIVDLGFGSLQVSLFDKDSLVTTQNLRLGALRIREMIGHLQTNTEIAGSVMEEIVDNELHTFKKMYLKDRDTKNLIAIGESVLYMSKRLISGDGMGSRHISREEYLEFSKKLMAMSVEQIEEYFEISTEYASVLLPSVIIYKRLLEITGAEMVWIPGVRLCDGVAAEYGEKTKQFKFKHDFNEDILVTSRNMAKRYRCHTSHTMAMEKLVLQIFDSMRKYHGLGSRQRLLLQISAILHACGKYISMRSPSDCAYNIIMATEIIGLSHLEREIIANVVQYNIATFHYSQVQTSDENFKNEDIIIIAKLTAILRLANSLDRSHKQKLMDSKIVVKDGELVITTGYDGDLTLEQFSFKQKAEFFEEIFGIRPVFKQRKKVY